MSNTNNNHGSKSTIIRKGDVCKKVGLSKSSIDRLIKQNKFPAPYILSTRSIGWSEQEIDAWIESRPRIQSDEVIL